MVFKIVKCLSCLLQVTQTWVYDIKHTELLKPLSCTDANTTNPQEKCGLLFIKCRWVYFLSEPISRCLNLGTCAVTISGILWTFLSSVLLRTPCALSLRGLRPQALMWSLCKLHFTCRSPVSTSFHSDKEVRKVVIRNSVLCLSIK